MHDELGNVVVISIRSYVVYNNRNIPGMPKQHPNAM